jgi:glucose/arabinose dehydrogenase
VKVASCLLGLAVLAVAASSGGAGTGIRVPAGYKVEVYASGLDAPTAMAFGPGNKLYVTQESGEVVTVTRGSKRPKVILRGFRSPLGLTWFQGTLVVSTQGTLWRVRGGQRAAIVKNLPFKLHQQDNVVVWRGRLYFGSGSTCNACAERSKLSAAVLSVGLDGRGLRVVASGARNPFGLAVDPGSNRLYVSVNGRDDLGRGEPAEGVYEVRQGRRFGWPACWPSYAKKRLAGSCRGVTPPLAYLQPHSSADGMAFWDGDLYVAEWGQYLSNRAGRKVTRVQLRPGKPALVSTFASGFSHPLAVAVDPEGALLVADYGRGVIYRISRRSKE